MVAVVMVAEAVAAVVVVVVYNAQFLKVLWFIFCYVFLLYL
jgi:hypothetical protein